MKSTMTYSELIPCFRNRFAWKKYGCRFQWYISFHVSFKWFNQPAILQCNDLPIDLTFFTELEMLHRNISGECGIASMGCWLLFWNWSRHALEIGSFSLAHYVNHTSCVRFVFDIDRPQNVCNSFEIIDLFVTYIMLNRHRSLCFLFLGPFVIPWNKIYTAKSATYVYYT